MKTPKSISIVPAWKLCPDCRFVYGQEHHCWEDFKPWTDTDLQRCPRCEAWVPDTLTHTPECHAQYDTVRSMLRAYAEEHVDGFIRDLDKVSVSSPNVPVEVHIDFYADGEGPLPSGSIRIAGKGRNLLEAIADAHRAIKDVEIPS